MIKDLDRLHDLSTKEAAMTKVKFKQHVNFRP